MLMIIFGAGASYDSSPTHPPPKPGRHDFDERPPLADQLFDNRTLFADAMRRYSECLAVIPSLRIRKEGEAIEEVMERLQEEAEDNPRRQRQLVAIRYYLQDMLVRCQSQWDQGITKGVTNYKTLLDTVEHVRNKDEPVCLVTFNYDTMIEDALPADVKQISDMTSYILASSLSYSLIKLHGSVDWGCEIADVLDANIPSPQQVIRRYPDLTVTDTYHRVEGQIPVNWFKETALFPAIAIPVQSKLKYECPKKHLDTLQALIPKVDKILVIGWRGTERPFLADLRDGLRNRPRVMTVCGNQQWGAETVTSLRLAGIVAEFLQPADYGFSTLVTRQHQELNRFLKQ